MIIISIMLVFIVCGFFLCWRFDLWPFNHYTKRNYEQTVKYLKACIYPYQEISYDVFVSTFPYLDKYAVIRTIDEFNKVGEHIIVNLPYKSQKVKYVNSFSDFYMPEYLKERYQCYILLFPDYKQHEQALAYMKDYRNKAKQMRMEKDFVERSSISVLKYCQNAIQKDIEETQKKMADACEDIKEKVKEINNV